MDKIKLRNDLFKNSQIIKLLDKNLYSSVLLYLQLLCDSHYYSKGFRIIDNIVYQKTKTRDYIHMIFNTRFDDFLALKNEKLIEFDELKIIIRNLNIDIDRNRTSKEYTFWRKSIFKRDNYTCQHCKKKGKVLNAHHKLKWSEYPKERYNIENGLTLCIKCHKEEHKKGKVKKNG